MEVVEMITSKWFGILAVVLGVLMVSTAFVAAAEAYSVTAASSVDKSTATEKAVVAQTATSVKVDKEKVQPMTAVAVKGVKSVRNSAMKDVEKVIPSSTKLTTTSAVATDSDKTLPQGSATRVICKGDVNLDGQVTFGDIDLFRWVLNHPLWQRMHKNSPILWAADITGDGRVNQSDVNPFVAILSGNAQPDCRTFPW
jgi:hypothetical protein